MRRAAGVALLGVALLAPPGRAALADVEAAARHVVEATNTLRHAEGLAPLGRNAALEAAASEFAAYMARTGRYGHSADGRRPHERARRHGYEYCMVLENIAYQYSSQDFATPELARRLVEGWKRSPGHRRNMLEPDATETAVAVARAPRAARYYAVQLFGRPASAAVRFEVRNESGEAVRYRVGERGYSLPPRVVRTHELCGPKEVAFAARGEGRPPRTFRPRGGDRFVVLQRRGAIEVRRE